MSVRIPPPAPDLRAVLERLSGSNVRAAIRKGAAGAPYYRPGAADPATDPIAAAIDRAWRDMSPAEKPTWKPALLMGRLSNGAQADGGRVVHAVRDSVVQYDSVAKAACYMQPGPGSGGWDVEHPKGKPVTCRRCAARINRKSVKP